MFLTIKFLTPVCFRAKTLILLVFSSPPLITGMLQIWDTEGAQMKSPYNAGTGAHSRYQQLGSKVLLSLTSGSTQGTRQPLPNTLTSKVPCFCYFTIYWLLSACQTQCHILGTQRWRIKHRYKDGKDKTPAFQESSESWGMPTNVKIVEQLHDRCNNRAGDWVEDL